MSSVAVVVLKILADLETNHAFSRATIVGETIVHKLMIMGTNKGGRIKQIYRIQQSE